MGTAKRCAYKFACNNIIAETAPKSMYVQMSRGTVSTSRSIDENKPCAKRSRYNSNMSITSDKSDDSDSECSGDADGDTLDDSESESSDNADGDF